jgi:predicted metal-dependent peptidase
MNSEKVAKAKIKLVLDHPFFATVFLKRPLIEDESIKTACTDGERFRYNPKWIESLPASQIVTVFCHEILHVVGMHHIRRNGRELKRWNWACDYVINLILKDNKFDIPASALLDEKYRGMTPERVYDLLDPEQFKDNEFTSLGDIEDPANGTGIGQIQKIKDDLAEASQVAKMRGKIPKGIDLQVMEAMKMGMNWKQILASFLTERTHEDYSWQRPNPRHAWRGIILPTLHSTGKGNFVLAIDSSGSNVAKEIMQKITNEVMEILSLSATPLTVLFCDSKIAHVQVLEPENPEPLQFKGGGGTDFSPVMKWIEENDVAVECLIYFTDLEVSSFPQEPDYSVLWATDNLKMVAPYGDTIYVD